MNEGFPFGWKGSPFFVEGGTMSETERRQRYVTNRVLIEAQRILNPQFDDAVVFLSGAQIELLRNVTQYLNRQSTYVAEYNSGYYLMPTVEDFDGILEIVADMEETLMGNPNVIWGYNDVYGEAEENLNMPAGPGYLYGSTVPEGEVWVVSNVMVTSTSATCVDISIYAELDGGDIIVGNVKPPVTGQRYCLQINQPLAEGNRMYVLYSLMTLGDDALAHFSGYKMKV